MTRFLGKRSLILGLAAFLAFFGQAVLGQNTGGASGPSTQVRPLLQDIKVPGGNAGDDPYLIKKTSLSAPKTDVAVPAPLSLNAIKTSIPILAETAIPGYSGVLVESLDGNVVVESGSNIALNPASNVKIATTYAILKTFGPDYRFPTSVWTDGSFDEASGTIYGNIYVSGRDPVFAYDHGVALAAELNRMGVRTVSGDLIVTYNFTMNYSSSPERSGQTLFVALDASKRPAAATRAWGGYLINSGNLSRLPANPGVVFNGKPYVQTMPSNAKILFTHESAPMREIVKAMMCYSNNFVAERLGDMLGGPFGVARVVQQNVGLQPSEFYIQTSSGLGVNRVTAAAMMKVLRALRSDLGRYRMSLTDIMAVAGMDKGTLENRFDTDFATGSVVGKTGTLGSTDGGVSALAGEINTRSGTFLFVIFNQRGSVSRFRSFQNNYVSLIQGQFGGPASVGYMPVSLDTRLAKTRFSYPAQALKGN